MAYGEKALPYLVRQFQLQEESRVILGSKVANAELADLQDLHKYNEQRPEELKKGVKPWLGYHVLRIMLGDLDDLLAAAIGDDPRPFSWIDWWEQNKARYVFETREPVKIDTAYKFHSFPHISTTRDGNFLTIDACSATYRQIIERAAAEMGVRVFIGEHPYLQVITNVRMRSVTFDEFAHLIGLTVSVAPFPYNVEDGIYRFGGDKPQEPRTICNKDWGIKMGKTVFNEGDKIPVTVIPRWGGEIIDPKNPGFKTAGSFRVTDNDLKVIVDYSSLSVIVPPEKMIKTGNAGEILLDVSDYCKLPSGEYNIRFKYLDKETPSMPIEVYRPRE